MAIAKKISEVYNFTSKVADGTATIICDKGECSISSDTDILGIEIYFSGKADITPELPEGWYLRGNKSKIIIFSMQNVPIKNSLLFKYNGIVNIKRVIVANSEAKQFRCRIRKDKSQWVRQDWSMSAEAGTWDDFKDITPNGKVKKTSYVINDDLPEVEPIKKTKKQIRRRKRSSGGY
tara:strand:+ start:1615 stop:2148 length:534 start_codon:yes stop_codon:yes gene_type:complete